MKTKETRKKKRITMCVNPNSHMFFGYPNNDFRKKDGTIVGDELLWYEI